MSASCPRCGAVSPADEVTVCPRCLLFAGDEEFAAVELELPGLSLRHELGRGGMGRVLLAEHVKLGREVAVKLIAPQLSLDPKFVARFEREARALARLNHPHIITVHDFGVTADGQAYLVMEYAARGTLAERIPLAPTRAIAVTRALAEALAAAHAAGIVHRDLKPQNVLFDAEDRPKLADFGLARSVDAADGLTHPALVAGTPAYMSPEARSGARPHPTTDIYALGILLREMLTGTTLPSSGKFSPPVRELIARATAELPGERFQGLSELVVALDALPAWSADGKFTDARSSSHAELPPEERSWLQAVSLAFAAANAMALYAFVLSFTPRVLSQNEPVPMIAFGVRPLADGHVYTRARFETWPTLTAGVAFAVALASYGVLRGHWRKAGLDGSDEKRPIASAHSVLKLGLALLLLFVVHRAIERHAAVTWAAYLPVFGGTLEFVLLYLVWLTLLEAARCQRPLHREYRLWLGLWLGLIPPVVTFIRVLLESQ
ncbi:MAG TPA: serine/threonine-protein kinase [Polyangiaceae bacterium]|nr:serine/threonine-protein kinase [Polyangiaceae bacterium]